MTCVGAATRLRRISELHQAHERFEIRADERRANLQDAVQPTRQPTTRRSPRASRAPAAIAATQGRADVNAFSVPLPPALIRIVDRDGSTAVLA